MNTIQLIGTEQVQAASRQMISAADKMQQAAGQLLETLQQNQRMQDDLLNRLEMVLREDRMKRGLPA